jgi:hypothetical protein
MRLIELLKKARIAWIVTAIVATILLFAVSSHLLSNHENRQGIRLNGSTDNVTFLDALYFSAVTISSLGYGDIQPLGI